MVFYVTVIPVTAVSLVLYAFLYISHKKTRKRVDVKGSIVKESFARLVNSFRQSRYIYIHTLSFFHVPFGHFTPSTVVFSLHISKFYWFFFVLRCVHCLLFMTRHIFTRIFFFFFNLALNLSLFCSFLVHLPLYHHISELKSCFLSNTILQSV